MSSANKHETDKPSETTILLIKQVARTYKTIVESPDLQSCNAHPMVWCTLMQQLRVQESRRRYWVQKPRP